MRTGAKKWGLLDLHRLSLNRRSIQGGCFGAMAMMTQITDGVTGKMATGKIPHWAGPAPALTKELRN